MDLLTQQATTLLIVAMGVLGLLLGSFANVVIARVPEGKSVVSPPSACPTCGHRIAWYDNVPILSWLLLRGRCRTCSQPISARYPIVEGVMALLFIACTTWLVRIDDLLALPGMLIFVFASACLFVIDMDTFRLPNAITLPLAGVTGVLLGGSALLQGQGERLYPMVFGVVFLSGLFYVIHRIYAMAMGLGDVKYAIAMGLALGYMGYGAVIVGYFIAFLTGSLWGLGMMAKNGFKRNQHLPFGPSLVIGAFLGLVYGQQLAQLYLDVSGL